MLFHASHNDPTEPTGDGMKTESAIRPDGSYEIVFNSDKKNTDYTTEGYNAYGFSANGSRKTPMEETPQSPKKEKKRRNIPLVMLVLSLVLTVFSVSLSIGTLIALHNQAPHPTLGTKPENPATLNPWVNPFDNPPTDAFSAATAKAINSVVVINAGDASGSGIVWACGDTYSYIVTCYHVVEGEKEIKITFQSGDVAYAEPIGGDAKTDIALLKVDKTDLSPIVLPNENAEMKLGQAVIAIGNPLGVFGNSVSDGILSSLTRTVSIDGSTMQLLQTTAAVNHGNSGGGLFDLNGQLIGLVNAKISQTSVEGIGFAIPYDTIKTVVGELIEKGFVSGRPTLGITTVMIDTMDAYNEAIRQYPDLESHVFYRDFFGQTKILAGLFVIDPSTVAGYGEGAIELAFGDCIKDIGTTQISSEADVQTALNGYNAGDTVQITFVRQNKKYITEITLGEIGKETGRTLSH